MCNRVLAAFIAVIVVSICSFALGAQEMLSPDPADLILRNGLVYTVDATNTMTEAVAIRDGKFVFVGSSKDAMKYRGKKTRVIDLKGQFVLPGFNDNHVHFASAAQFLEFNIMRAATQQEFIARVKDVVSRLPKGEWIMGGFWGAYDQWAAGSTGGGRREAFTPDMRAVEVLTKDHPMFIRKFDDSEFAVNASALRAVGIDPSDPKLPVAARAAMEETRRQGTEPAGSNIEGVEFLRDAGGRFTGHLRGRGVRSLFASVETNPPPSAVVEARRPRLRKPKLRAKRRLPKPERQR